MDYQLLAHLPYNLDQLRTGYNDPRQLLADNNSFLQYLSGYVKLQEVAADYAASFVTSQTPTMLHYRDYLISKALYYTLDNILFYNANETILTGHAEKALSRYSLDNFYPSNYRSSTYTNPSRFSGLVGSLAYYFLYTSAEGYPIDYINELLRYIWSIHGVSYDLAPRERLLDLLDIVGQQIPFNTLVAQTLKEIFSRQPEDDGYNWLILARREGLTANDGLDFNSSILSGTYVDFLIPLLQNNLEDRQAEFITTYVNNVLSIAKPVGFPLLIQALIVEGFIKAAEVINQQPEEIANTNKALFLSSRDIAYQPVRKSIAENLATAYDALDYLVTNNIVDRELLFDDFIVLGNLIYEWLPPDIPTDSPIRLSSIITPRPISSRDTPGGVSDFYRELAKRYSDGSVVLNRSIDNGNNFTYVAVDYNQSTPPVISFITPDGQRPSVTVNQSNSISLPSSTASELLDNPRQALEINDSNINIQSGPLVGVNISNVSSNGILGAVAITNNTNQPIREYSTFNPAQLNQIESDPNVSTSNVVITQPTQNLQDLSQSYSQGVRIVQGLYQTYLGINTLNLPRGGSDQAYRALSLNQPLLTPSQTQTFFRTKIDGAYEDYLGRMASLVKTLTRVHADSEVKELRNWAADLPIGHQSQEGGIQ